MVYIDGSYSYPLTDYGNSNSFLYNLGNFNNSYIDNLSSTSKNLKLFWKIPPRIFLESNLSHNNVNYLPIYNNLIIEYKEQNELSWNELLNINNFPDPSNNSNYSNYNNDNINFIFNLTRNTSVPNNTYNYNITDNSFIINFNGGYNFFQNSKSYQFRCYLDNISNIVNNFDYKEDNYYNNNDSSNNYLYFPDLSNIFFLTASRGLPKSPTDLTFSSILYNSVFISGELDSNTADVNNIISIPIPNDDDDNKLIFIFDLNASKNSNYKKFIPYNLNNYTIDNLNNSNNPSINGEFSFIENNSLEPEFSYSLNNYGMYFANDNTNISYAQISRNFITPIPLRNEINNSYNNFINSYSLFNNNLINYNSNLINKTIRWRENNQNIILNFFDNLNSIFNIFSNNLQNKLYNSLNSNNINTSNEPVGNDFINNNLSSFVMFSKKVKNNVETNVYNTLQIDTSFNNFLTKSIKNSDTHFTFNYTTQDILPNNNNSLNDYSSKNGYYVGLILNDICFNIDLNDFFDENNDLSFNNIKLKTGLSQNFSNIVYNNLQNYNIYKITNDLTNDITLDSSNSDFSLNYDESNIGSYFGLTSIKPHNTLLHLNFDGTLNNLSKYMRNYNNDILCNINLKITGSLNSSNSNNELWETNNNNIKNINHSYNYYPLNN